MKEGCHSNMELYNVLNRSCGVHGYCNSPGLTLCKDEGVTDPEREEMEGCTHTAEKTGTRVIALEPSVLASHMSSFLRSHHGNNGGVHITVSDIL